MKDIKRFRGPCGLTLELDPEEQYEGGTPMMVYRGGYSATPECALDTGRLYNGDDECRLSDFDLMWLEETAYEAYHEQD